MPSGRSVRDSPPRSSKELHLFLDDVGFIPDAATEESSVFEDGGVDHADIRTGARYEWRLS